MSVSAVGPVSTVHHPHPQPEASGLQPHDAAAWSSQVTVRCWWSVITLSVVMVTWDRVSLVMTKLLRIHHWQNNGAGIQTEYGSSECLAIDWKFNCQGQDNIKRSMNLLKIKVIFWDIPCILPWWWRARDLVPCVGSITFHWFVGTRMLGGDAGRWSAGWSLHYISNRLCHDFHFPSLLMGIGEWWRLPRHHPAKNADWNANNSIGIISGIFRNIRSVVLYLYTLYLLFTYTR